MTESPFEFFSNLITRQAAVQQLRRCECGGRPVVVEDPVRPSFWVGCKVIIGVKDSIGCGIGYFAKTEAQAMQRWQENANNKQ